MDSKGVINDLGGQYIGDPNPQPGGRNAALALNPSLWLLVISAIPTIVGL